MKRRLQGLCLLLLGAVLGWVGGGELARGRWRPEPWAAVYVGLMLVSALAAVFVGLVFVSGVRLFSRGEGRPTSRPHQRPGSSHSE
ncbi:MAG: hypothetical protein U0797_10515 [Gemmataceae bacterium]